MGIASPLVFVCTTIYIHVISASTPKILLNDGQHIPVIALGTGRSTAQQNDTVEDVRQAVYWALEQGYEHIDTASIYQDEKQVGEGIADAFSKGLVKRDDIFVTTKLWGDKHARSAVVPALKESLKQLNLDYVNLYLIHFPVALKPDGSPDDIDYLETWKGMEEAKRLGLTKSIGVSNFNAAQIKRLFANSEVKPAVNQIEVNPTNTQEDLVNTCQKLGVAVMAFSPFGFLVSRRTSPVTPAPRVDDPKLTELAQKYGKTTGQITLRYLLDRGLIIIPKSTNKSRIKQNIDILDFKLTDSEVSSINQFNKNIRVINMERWKNYPHYPF